MTYTKDNIEFLPKPTALNFIDIEGQTFGRLTVLGFAGRYPLNRNAQWFCECVCGTIIKTIGASLRNGHVHSCGCLRLECVAEANTKHGMSDTSEHRIWVKLRNRCNNPRNDKFADYGGRGITVCARWDDFANFLADMGERPTPKHTVERIDNNKGYAPDNCDIGRTVRCAFSNP